MMLPVILALLLTAVVGGAFVARLLASTRRTAPSESPSDTDDGAAGVANAAYFSAAVVGVSASDHGGHSGFGGHHCGGDGGGGGGDGGGGGCDGGGG